MALVLADRVLETTTTTGSGTITLAGAEPGYQSFSAVGNGNQTYYTITADTVWEVGIGTYTASGTTLSRDTVLSSSASGAKVTLPSGVKKVFVTYPSEKSVNLDVSGNISLSSAVISGVGYPSANSDAATKLYVDTLAAEGISYHTPVKYEVPNTTGNLTATYNNGTAGVSATLTNAGTLGPFVPDGVTASISDRVLIYNQTNGYENGVYTVTTVGTGASSWVLTRATDADTYGVKSPTALGTGDAFYVTSGNTGAGETYVCNTPGTIVFGSTNITFVQVSAAQVYQAGTGISLTNTTISLVSPVVVATGGTGLTSTPTNGQLLIGNGSGYTLSTLTAGSGVSITNSAGSITLSATGLGGTVTAVTATGPLASSGGTTPDISIANLTGTGSVVLDQGATISSATITAALSASITTITGSSANITTVTGTTTTFSSGTISQLGATSATITTLSGTNVTYSSGTVSQLAATSATISTVSGTNATYSNGNFTSATVTNASGTNLSYGSATITTGNLTFSSTGQRITGDMSNATIGNRLAFQTSTTNGNTDLQIIPNGTSVTSGIRLNNNSDTTNAGYVRMSLNSTEAGISVDRNSVSGTYLPLGFNTGGSERMRLDTSGNLGIGTASPVAGYRLNVVNDSGNSQQLIRAGTNFNSTIAFGDQDSSTSGQLIYAHNGDYMAFNTNAAERMRIDSSGNVGIGTASPDQRVTINSANTSTNSLVSFKQAGTTYAYVGMGSDNKLRLEAVSTDVGIQADSANVIFFNTNGSERFRIGSAGQLGVGGANYGTSGQVLTSNGSSSAPSWQTAGAGSQIKSIQRGNGLYSNGNTPVSITISSVTISKSVVNYLGTAPETTGTYYSGQGYFVLTSATNLNFTARYSTAGPYGQYASWEIIEYV